MEEVKKDEPREEPKKIVVFNDGINIGDGPQYACCGWAWMPFMP